VEDHDALRRISLAVMRGDWEAAKRIAHGLTEPEHADGCQCRPCVEVRTQALLAMRKKAVRRGRKSKSR